MKKITIGKRKIGHGERPYVIAEFGVNHNGSLRRAKEGIRKAAAAGADAIKFQTYTADELVVKGTPKFWEWDGDKDKAGQHESYAAIGGFPYEWYPELIAYCKKLGIEFLSTAFSFEGADFLNSIGMKAFKVASSDLSTLPYLAHIAKYKKPILLSTGAATMEEVREAVATIKAAGNNQIVVLHCTLHYPTEDQHANLNLIQTLAREFPDLVVGISDHTLGVFPTVIAAAHGAHVIEKHYTVDKTLPDSPDHWLSVDPIELKAIVDGIRAIHVLRGSDEKKVFAYEKDTRKYDKRSIVSKVNIPKGTVITERMITYKRPGTGIWPKFKNKVVGKKARKNISADTTLTWTMV